MSGHDPEAIVEALIARLDEAHEQAEPGGPRQRWDLWRTMGNGWVVQVKDSTGHRTESVNRPTLVGALTDATKIEFLPEVPHRPALGDAEVRKHPDGRSWQIYRDGATTGKIATKREATAIAERWNKARDEGIVQWEARYRSVVDAGMPGIDFEWKDR